MKLWKNEPVRVWAAIQTLVLAVVNLAAVASAWEPTPDQLAAVNGVLAAASALVAALFVRGAVTPSEG